MGGDVIWGFDGEVVVYIIVVGFDKINLKLFFIFLFLVIEDLIFF